MLGKTVNVVIDRPLGSTHPKYSNIRYPVNYGYVPGLLGGDGEGQDVYVLGVDTPIETFFGTIIGVIHRLNDVEDKWVAAPDGMVFTREEIWDAVKFQEQYFDSELRILEKSCGTIPYTVREGEIRYLLIQTKNGVCGFPKGHVEKGETEEETAVRETVEETSVVPRLLQGFRREHGYELKNGNSKTVTYFVGEFGTENPRKNGDFEDFEYLLLPFNEAIRALTFENTKELLTEADEFIGVRVNP